MGERCFLRTHNHPKAVPTGSGIDTYAHLAFEPRSDMMPLLWLALFQEDELQTVVTKSHFLEDFPDMPEAVVVEVPYLFTTVEAALRNFESRLPLIYQRTNPGLKTYIEDFHLGLSKFSTKFDHRFIQFDTYTIWHERCGGDAQILKALLSRAIRGMDSETSWVNTFGATTVCDTFNLYGLPFFSPPFDGIVDLPWCHVAEDGSIRESEPRNHRIFYDGHRSENTEKPSYPCHKIDDGFSVEHDTSPENVDRFATAFRVAWDQIDLVLRSEMTKAWDGHAMLSVPMPRGEGKRFVSADETAYLGLFEDFPFENYISKTIGRGLGMLWCAKTIQLMDDATLSAFIACNIAYAYCELREEPIDEQTFPGFVKEFFGAELSKVTDWGRQHVDEMNAILEEWEQG